MHRLMEQLALCTFVMLAFFAALQITTLAIINAWTVLFIAPSVFLALATADLVSGVMHFMLDCKGRSDTPFWGIFIRPFREHHDDPSEMTQHDFIHTNGHTAIAICPLLLTTMIAYREPMDTTGTLQFVFLSSLLLFLGLTNQFHKWAHASYAPGLVRKLQAVKLILPPQDHARHHATHRDHFCITTGWNNAWLEKTQLLQRVFRETEFPRAQEGCSAD
jgi:ubiquitin-conjugating enzyme E2 variant